MNYKIKMNVIICLLIFLGSSATVIAQFQNEFYAVRPYQQNFLRYNFYSDNFDSATLHMVVGEFSIKANGNIYRVPLKWYDYSQSFDGDTTQGLDNILSALGVSSIFALPSNDDTVQFFRRMTISAVPTGTGHFFDSASLTSTNSYDAYWNVGTNKVLDNVEFVIELVRKTDNVTLSIIDSVGILANPASSWPHRYGNEVEQPFHSVPVNGLTSGDSAFFRVKVKRTGSTPYGLAMQQNSVFCNYSASVCDSSGHRKFVSEAESDTLNKHYWQEICFYYDSTISATGKLPKYLIPELPQGYESEYRNRYFDSIGIYNGNIQYSPKYELLAKSSIPNEILSTNTNTYKNIAGEVKIRKVTPVPSNGGLIKFEVDNTMQSLSGVKTNVLDVNGVSSPCGGWQGNLIKGKTIIELQTSTLASGTYILQLEDAEKTTLCTMRFIISK
ncbi:MAG: hypothetical protein U0Y96_12480 [Candidatus Kapaibacterium sp.]|nr:hypothetical protein [Bacteroidota bacterium]